MQKRRAVTAGLEETLIAAILGVMTLITFANVIVRKTGGDFLLFEIDGNILWAKEATVFLFAWLVLLGTSYAVRIGAHLGVDALLNIVSKPMRKVLGLISVTICIAFAFLMLKGAWDYWANFANLPQTTGRWFPTGFEESFRGKGWYESYDIPMPGFLRFMEDMFNDGDEYEKIPRLIPYFILPLSMALLLFRFLQSAWWLWTGKIDTIIASHEVEDAVDALAAERKD